MAKQSDFQKAINYIKRLIGNKDMKIPNSILDNLMNILGFNISIATIIENVKEQEITYADVIVDDLFLYNYIKTNLKYIKKYPILNSDKTELEKFELTFKEIITMIYEEYNQKTFTSLYLSDKQTQYEKIAWDSLFRYVKYNILHYDKDQLLEPKIIQKLKELQNGRILGNNKQVALCRYSFDDILLTFKFCYFDIQKYTQSKRFENNVKKFNYICAIVRDNINTVIERKKIKQEANERLLKSNNFGYVNTNKAEYVKKTEECLPELESLW